MKLQLSDNVLRMRLSSEDVEAMVSAGSVSGKTCFTAGAHLSYRLQSNPDATDICAELDSSQITICIPETLAAKWAHGEGISLSAMQKISDGKSLEILIEKDLHS